MHALYESLSRLKPFVGSYSFTCITMASPEFTGPLPNGKYYIQKHNTNSFVGLEKDILDPRPPHSVNVVLFPAEIKQTVVCISPLYS